MRARCYLNLTLVSSQNNTKGPIHKGPGLLITSAPRCRFACGPVGLTPTEGLTTFPSVSKRTARLCRRGHRPSAGREPPSFCGRLFGLPVLIGPGSHRETEWPVLLLSRDHAAPKELNASGIERLKQPARTPEQPEPRQRCCRSHLHARSVGGPSQSSISPYAVPVDPISPPSTPAAPSQGRA